MNKKMKIFLSFSVLLNVLFVGMMAGGLSKPHMNRGHEPAHVGQRLEKILEVLPVDKKNEFEQRMLVLKALRKADKETMKSARKSIMQVFTEEPFDKVAYQESVERLNQLHQKQMSMRVDLMSDMAEYLSPRERRKLSRLLMKLDARKNNK